MRKRVNNFNMASNTNMDNNTFKEIADKILSCNTMLIYPHVNIDGDAMGSSVALCRALRLIGKKAYILLEEDVPRNLAFLDNGYCTKDENIIGSVDLSICVDCGNLDRFPGRKESFLRGREYICIDHHETNAGQGENLFSLKYIDSKAAATGELIFKLIGQLGIEKDVEIGEAIFAAITTDTGNFQYGNTTKESHLMVAALYDWGINASKVSVEIYENVTKSKLDICNKALSTMELVASGKGAVCYVTSKMMEEAKAESGDTDSVVASLRSIQGVEIAAFVKEKEEGLIRVSLRAKSYANVARIAARFDGGGHIKAAGCTLHMGLDEALKIIKEEICKELC